MSRIRSRDTGPELLLRRLVHGLGYRYRVHNRGVPGSPDLSIKTKRKAVFLHGCFWHRHNCISGRRKPKSRCEFWEQKFTENVERDKRTMRKLKRLGWTVLVVWECQLKYPCRLERRIREFMDA